MNNFNEKFIIKTVVKEFTKGIKENIDVRCFIQGVRYEPPKKISVIATILNSNGIIGFGVYFAERYELIIYDSNGNIISIHKDMIFTSRFKGKQKGSYRTI